MLRVGVFLFAFTLRPLGRWSNIDIWGRGGGGGAREEDSQAHQVLLNLFRQPTNELHPFYCMRWSRAAFPELVLLRN